MGRLVARLIRWQGPGGSGISLAVPPSPSDLKPEYRLATRVLRGVNRTFSRIYHHVDVLRPCQLPERGAAILVSNHTSALDPLLIQSTCRRVIVWMMAKEYYEVRAMNWLFRAVDAIPVQRSGADLAATRAAMRALQQGRVVGIFPEGKIETSREMFPFQTGVALMAIKTNVPVFPAYLDGTQRYLEMVPAVAQRQRATLRFGSEVSFDRGGGKEALQPATDTIQAAVAALRDDARDRR